MRSCIIVSLMAILMFASDDVTSSMHSPVPSHTIDDVTTTSKVDGISPYTVADIGAQLFLQTPGAKAIAGVFALASIVVTCIQVCFACNMFYSFNYLVLYFEEQLEIWNGAQYEVAQHRKFDWGSFGSQLLILQAIDYKCSKMPYLQNP